MSDEWMVTINGEPVYWHGWGIVGGPSLHVGYLPGRKSPCLYIEDGTEARALAYFRDEESAATALDVLDQLVTLEVGEPFTHRGETP